MSLLFRLFLIAVMAAFFANLYAHWFDPAIASVALLSVFSIGVAVYRRIWVRPDSKLKPES